jgi:hypothetical protein
MHFNFSLFMVIDDCNIPQTGQQDASSSKYLLIPALQRCIKVSPSLIDAALISLVHIGWPSHP